MVKLNLSCDTPLAAIVVREALDQTRNEGLKILPTCSYVEKFVAENPVYQA